MIDQLGDVDFEDYDADEEDDGVEFEIDSKCLASFTEHNGNLLILFHC